MASPETDLERVPAWPGWRSAAAAALGYLTCLAAAAPGVVSGFGRTIPGHGPDPLIHLWTMRWYERCLIEWRSPLFCEGLNYPAGLPIGLNPALHLPALEFLLLGPAFPDDLRRYALIWILAFLGAGLGAAWLAWTVTRDGTASWLAGLMVMLSGPMALHGRGHIELIQVGSLPLFFGCWLRWLGRPGAGRLLGAVGAYLLVAMSAQYFALMAVLPAAVMVGFAAARSGSGPVAWLRSRLAGLAAFGALAGLGIGVLYSGQLAAMIGGTSMVRPREQFDRYGAPWWSYVVPPPLDDAAPAWSRSFYTPEYLDRLVEIGSYPGLAMLALLGVAGLARVRFERRGLWWTLLAVAVVLSFGSALKVGGVSIPMPSALLHRFVPPIRLTRVPARYNILATVFGAVIAAVALRSIFAGLARSWMRWGVALGLIALVLFEQRLGSIPCSAPPPPPRVYAEIAAIRPGAGLLEIPQMDARSPMEATWLAGQLAYWQSHHGLRTTAAYSAVANTPYLDLLAATSPFLEQDLRREDYADGTPIPRYDLVQMASLPDLAWLYAHAHSMDFLVVHSWHGEGRPALRASLARLRRMLAPAQVLGDESIGVYDVARLEPPREPVALPTSGWVDRQTYRGRWAACVLDHAELAAFNPDSSGRRELVLEAIAVRGPVRVRLREGGTPLAEWDIPAGAYSTRISPPFWLSPGPHNLTLDVVDAEPAAQARAAGRVPLGVSAIVFRRAREAPLTDAAPGTLRR